MNYYSERVAQMATTRTGLRIGIAHIPRQTYEASLDQTLMQKSFLDKRTAYPMSAMRKFAGAIWAWL